MSLKSKLCESMLLICQAEVDIHKEGKNLYLIESTCPCPCLSKSTTTMSTIGPRLVNVSIT